MYEIYVHKDGGCSCVGRIQDGKERWSEKNVDDAVKSMITFAKVMNGTKIKRKDILILQEKTITKTEWVPYIRQRRFLR